MLAYPVPRVLSTPSVNGWPAKTGAPAVGVARGSRGVGCCLPSTPVPGAGRGQAVLLVYCFQGGCCTPPCCGWPGCIGIGACCGGPAGGCCGAAYCCGGAAPGWPGFQVVPGANSCMPVPGCWGGAWPGCHCCGGTCCGAPCGGGPA